MMRELKLLEISLNKQNPVYFTNQQLQGTLTVEAERDIKLTGKFINNCYH